MSKPSQQKSSSLLYDLLFSIALPSLFLTRGPDIFPNLSPVTIFILALSIPIMYGIYDQLTNKNFNIISFLGFLNVLLTGGLGLLQATKILIVIKEAGFPLLIGIFCIIFNSRLQKHVYTHIDTLLNVKRITQKISQKKFKEWIKRVSLYFSFPFFLSSLLNGILTYIIIQSQPGTQEFNSEIGRLLIWGYAGIAIPCIIFTLLLLWYLLASLKADTGLSYQELFKDLT